MRFVLDEELDVYEAFASHGLGDGDHPLAGEVKGWVYARLDSLGWSYGDVMTIHNNGFIADLTAPDGEEYDLDPILNDCEDGPSIRQAMIDHGLPKGLIEALDELNNQIVNTLVV